MEHREPRQQSSRPVEAGPGDAGSCLRPAGVRGSRKSLRGVPIATFSSASACACSATLTGLGSGSTKPTRLPPNTPSSLFGPMLRCSWVRFSAAAARRRRRGPGWRSRWLGLKTWDFRLRRRSLSLPLARLPIEKRIYRMPAGPSCVLTICLRSANTGGLGAQCSPPGSRRPQHLWGQVRQRVRGGAASDRFRL